MYAREIAWFSGQMIAKLDANSHKGGFKDMSDDELMEMLREEVKELAGSLDIYGGHPLRSEEVAQEAADIANFAMFIAWNNRRKKR